MTNLSIMMLLRYLLFLLLLLNVSACIPYKIAPNYSEGKVVKGKKFIKTFKNRYVFAFNDPKEANAFYTYINYKFQTSYDDDLGNVPIRIEDELAYLTFYELEKTTETYNLFPMMVDGVLSERGVDPVLESQYNFDKYSDPCFSSSWFASLLIIRIVVYIKCAYIQKEEKLKLMISLYKKKNNQPKSENSFLAQNTHININFFNRTCNCIVLVSN